MKTIETEITTTDSVDEQLQEDLDANNDETGKVKLTTTESVDEQLQEDLDANNDETGKVKPNTTKSVDEQLQEALDKNDFEKAKNLVLKHECNVNLQSKDTEKTILLLAVVRNEKDLVECLLKKKANINHQDHKGFSAVMLACELENKEILEKLLKIETPSIDINSQNKNGTTALMIAVKIGNSTIVDILLKAEAKQDIQDKKGQTASDYARKKGNKEIKKMLSNNETICSFWCCFLNKTTPTQRTV